MTPTPSTPTDGAPDTVARVAVPAQVVRRPADAPRPVPSPRRPQDGAPAPAGLPDADVPGLYTPEPTGRTEPLAPWALLAGILVPPLGIVLGAVALHRIRRRASRGRALAVCGVLVGALVSAVLVLVVVLSALVGVGSAGSAPSGAPASGAVSQTCSGSICTVTARGAPVTVDGIGVAGGDGVSVLAIGEGSAAVASPEGPLEVPTGTALELQGGTQVVLTQAGGDTVVFLYQR